MVKWLRWMPKEWMMVLMLLISRRILPTKVCYNCKDQSKVMDTAAWSPNFPQEA
jgi:hypothetical protein